MPTPVPTHIRAIPKGSGWASNALGPTSPTELYFELTNVPWKDQQSIRAELDAQGYFVQDIYFSDPMPIQVGMEIRKRYEAEQEQQK